MKGGFRNLRNRAVLAALLLGLPSTLCARGLPDYKPQRKVAGKIRIWGSQQMRELVRLWEQGFVKYQPQVRFEDRLNGTVSAMAGLYSGAADLALMGREVWPIEALAYRQMMGFAPTGVMVATGSFDVPTKADALVIFVHRDNPLDCLTLRQLDGIFGAEHMRGDKKIRTWGDLGLNGEWSNRRIDPYGYRIDNAAAIFFRTLVMKGSLLWNPAIRQFGNITGPGESRIDSGRQILDGLAADRYGIAISNPYYAGPEVKAVALSEGTGKTCVAPIRENVRNRSYPLTRAAYVFFVRRPGRPLDPRIAEFLRYVLSGQGQRLVGREGAYMPLPDSVVAQQVHVLKRFSGSPGTREVTAGK